jgi:uncharacterized protein
VHQRQVALTLQTRANDDGTLTLDGIAVPWDAQIDYGGEKESFRRGAFDAGDAVGRPLLWSHNRDEPVGHITAAEDSDEGLRISAIVQPTQRGQDAITLLRGGSLTGLSVGFEPTETARGKGRAVEYVSARLHELSLTPLPAYPQAAVTATREEEVMTDTTTQEREEAAPVVDLAPIRTRLDHLEARMISNQPAIPPRSLGVLEAIGEQLRDAVKHRQVRALADVLSSGNVGILPPTWSSEVLGYLDATRYLFPRTGTVAFPATGHSITIPRITQNTLVAARGTEKTDIPSRALTTASTPYTAVWYAGGDDIALELIEQSSPEVVGIVVQNLFQQYALVTDKAFTLAAETAASPVGAVLDFTSYKTLVTQLVTVSEQIRAITGMPGDRLSLTPASWGKLVSLTDADGRRILSSNSGGTGNDGSVNLVTPTVDIGGIQAFFNGNAVEDMQYNESALRKAEKPPLQVQSTNVTKMGQDVGILGAIITLPLYPTAIKVYSLTTQEDPASRQAKK